jgi:hypothetical protein
VTILIIPLVLVSSIRLGLLRGRLFESNVLIALRDLPIFRILTSVRMGAVLCAWLRWIDLDALILLVYRTCVGKIGVCAHLSGCVSAHALRTVNLLPSVQLRKYGRFGSGVVFSYGAAGWPKGARGGFLCFVREAGHAHVPRPRLGRTLLADLREWPCCCRVLSYRPLCSPALGCFPVNLQFCSG